MADLHARPAAYEVMREFLAIQRQSPPRSRAARFFGRSPLHKDAVPWFTGTLGELRVGQLLARLGPEWTVLHSIPIGDRGSDIDHLVIGPPGAFTVNTKRHRGQRIWVGEHQLRVGGQKTDHLRNARHEADRAARILGTPVSPLLVIVAAVEITLKGRQSVSVIRDSQLLRTLKRSRRTLSPEQIKTVVDVAASPQTWTALQFPALEHGLRQEFAALQSEDERARRIRSGWLALALVALLVGLGLFVVQVLPGELLRILTG